MLQGLVEGLISVSMSLILLSSRLDFFFVIRCPPSKSLTQMIIAMERNTLLQCSNICLSLNLRSVYVFIFTLALDGLVGCVAWSCCSITP